MIAPNIFAPRNNWNVVALRCRKYRNINSFENELARIIKDETGIHPFENNVYRGGRYAQARQLLVTFMVDYTNKTLSTIGKLINKDHATVMHSVKSIHNMYDTDKRFRAMYDRIDAKVKLLKNP
jgi:hypothetical protein